VSKLSLTNIKVLTVSQC